MFIKYTKSVDLLVGSFISVKSFSLDNMPIFLVWLIFAEYIWNTNKKNDCILLVQWKSLKTVIWKQRKGVVSFSIINILVKLVFSNQCYFWQKFGFSAKYFYGKIYVDLFPLKFHLDIFDWKIEKI